MKKFEYPIIKLLSSNFYLHDGLNEEVKFHFALDWIGIAWVNQEHPYCDELKAFISNSSRVSNSSNSSPFQFLSSSRKFYKHSTTSNNFSVLNVQSRWNERRTWWTARKGFEREREWLLYTLLPEVKQTLIE